MAASNPFWEHNERDARPSAAAAAEHHIKEATLFAKPTHAQTD